jgi:hypothetical protein
MTYLLSQKTNKNNDLEKDEEYVNSIFNNKLSGSYSINSSTYGFEINNMLDDEKTLYKHNQFGYRSDFWDGSHEILGIGCSVTYGRGIPEDGRWTNILQELTNKKVANLSSPGQSINFLVSQAFAYFKTFGNPEYVICFFPDPFRITLPTNKKLINSKNHNGYATNVSIQVSSNETVDEKPNFLKKPFYYEDILPLEVPVFFAMQSIHFLEQYCNANKIKLIWSSWHDFFQLNFSNLNENSFNNFFYNEELLIKDTNFNHECHLEHKEKFDNYFIHARDTKKINNRHTTHSGAHQNIHFAEAFYKEIDKRSFND